jgi:hypothetical protein
MYLVKDFYNKNAVLGDFSIKKLKCPPVCDGVFVYSGWLGVIYEPQATNRSAAGGEGSHRASSLLPIGHT